jgi:hypothetical protein
MIAVLNGHVIGNFNNNNFEETPTVLTEFGIDCVYGSSTPYGIRAKFADLQLATHALSESIMKNITTCKTFFEGRYGR